MAIDVMDDLVGSAGKCVNWNRITILKVQGYCAIKLRVAAWSFVTFLAVIIFSCITRRLRSEGMRA
jgi:hypothetical protein